MAERQETDYPDGDGAADCPKCGGRGVVPMPLDKMPAYVLPGTTQFCECVYKRDLMDNLKRGWKPLTRVKSTKNSPFVGKTRQNWWFRCGSKELAGHVRAAVLRHSPRWRFSVITDADIMTTWLYSANEVFDADVGRARLKGDNNASRVSDLVEPYDLLIIRLGFKAARNVATPEVFLEALLHRENLDLPTWVIDTPTAPLRSTHRAWDEGVQEHMADYYQFLDLTEGETVVPVTPYVPPPVYNPMGILEDSGGHSVLEEDGRVKIRKRDWRNEQ